VREDSDLTLAHGEAIGGETRVNPDGTLDISRWGRPQHDGPALRALTLLRWTASAALDPGLESEVAALLRADLAYVLKHGGQPCVDIWEEEHALHYYTVCVSAAALEQGARWLMAQTDMTQADACRAEAARLRQKLDQFCLAPGDCYRSRRLPSGAISIKELDIAMILAAVHAGSAAPRHSPCDPRLQATLAELEAVFEADYPINQNRPLGLGPAMGRYRGDVYYSGGAYYFATLGAAEFCFRAAACGDASEEARRWFERGEAYLRTVRRYTPPNGEMSEQFDQRTGLPNSAKELSWSYAAFISCVDARRRCIRQRA
jgi:glucoamylase